MRKSWGDPPKRSVFEGGRTKVRKKRISQEGIEIGRQDRFLAVGHQKIFKTKMGEERNRPTRTTEDRNEKSKDLVIHL